MSGEHEQAAETAALPDQGAVLMDALVRYCLTAGPPWCYRGWPPSLLKNYLLFHLLNGTLAWAGVGTKGLNIIGCGVAWQCWENDIRLSERLGVNAFQWKATDPRADSLFFADFICSAPGMMTCLINEFEKRFPHWRALKWFTYRKGRLVRLNKTRYQGRFDPKIHHGGTEERNTI